MDIRRTFSLKHLLCLLYLLALLLLVALLTNERRREAQPFTLSGSSATTNQEVGVLSIHGGKFSPGLKGVLASNLVNEKARLWQLLATTSTRSVDVAKQIALVSCDGQKLISISLSAGEPHFLGSLDLPANITGIEISGDTALVALERHAGFSLIDIRDPSDMKLVARYPLAGLVSNMIVDRNTVYFTNLADGLGRIDLSAKHPVPEMLVTLEKPWRLALQGARLAVGTIKGKVHLFNRPDKGPLIEAGSLDFPQNVRGVALTAESLAVALADGTLQVFNLSSWPNLGQGVKFKLPGRPLLLECIPGREGVAASLIAGGVALVDLSQRSAPRLLGHLKISQTLYDMKLQSGRIFGATQSGLQAFSLEMIANGEDAMLAPNAVLDMAHHQLMTWNDHLYGYNKGNRKLVDFGESGVQGDGVTEPLLAIPTPEGINYAERSREGAISMGGPILRDRNVTDARFRGEVLYVLNRQGLRIFEAAQPEVLVKLSELPLSEITGYFALLDSGYLLASSVDGGLVVVDIHDHSRPVQLARLTFPQNLPKGISYQNLLIYGQQVFISQPDKGVYVVDMSTPLQPELLQIIETPGFSKEMVIYDGLLLIADGVEGVYMVDVSDRDKALPIGSWPVPLRASKIAVTCDSVIVSNPSGGTMRLPLPHRLQNLKIVNRSEARADVDKVEERQYVYLYDEQTTAKAKVKVQ